MMKGGGRGDLHTPLLERQKKTFILETFVLACGKLSYNRERRKPVGGVNSITDFGGRVASTQRSTAVSAVTRFVSSCVASLYS
jgi:hypothetical protein